MQNKLNITVKEAHGSKPEEYLEYTFKGSLCADETF